MAKIVNESNVMETSIGLKRLRTQKNSDSLVGAQIAQSVACLALTS